MCSIHLLISTIQSYVAVVGRVITDDEDGTQQFPEELQFTTHIERLDSILNLVGMNIGLMKMDAQGFECKILQGMGQYIPMDIKFIKTEFSTIIQSPRKRNPNSIVVWCHSYHQDQTQRRKHKYVSTPFMISSQIRYETANNGVIAMSYQSYGIIKILSIVMVANHIMWKLEQILVLVSWKCCLVLMPQFLHSSLIL